MSNFEKKPDISVEEAKAYADEVTAALTSLSEGARNVLASEIALDIIDLAVFIQADNIALTCEMVSRMTRLNKLDVIRVVKAFWTDREKRPMYKAGYEAGLKAAQEGKIDVDVKKSVNDTALTATTFPLFQKKDPKVGSN